MTVLLGGLEPWEGLETGVSKLFKGVHRGVFPCERFARFDCPACPLKLKRKGINPAIF